MILINMEKKEYPKGIYWNKRHDKSPDFILGKINIDREKTIAWLQEKQGQYVRLQLMKPIKSEDIPYLQVDNWVKQEDFDNSVKEAVINVDESIDDSNINPDDIPFN